MARTASKPQHGLEQGLWFFILLAVIMGLAFVTLFLFAPQ